MTCGDPPLLPHAGQVWNGSITVGSTVMYYCNGGFYYVTGTNISECSADGYWTKPTVTCEGNGFHFLLVSFLQSFVDICFRSGLKVIESRCIL